MSANNNSADIEAQCPEDEVESKIIEFLKKPGPRLVVEDSGVKEILSQDSYDVLSSSYLGCGFDFESSSIQGVRFNVKKRIVRRSWVFASKNDVSCVVGLTNGIETTSTIKFESDFKYNTKVNSDIYFTAGDIGASLGVKFEDEIINKGSESLVRVDYQYPLHSCSFKTDIASLQCHLDSHFQERVKRLGEKLRNGSDITIEVDEIVKDFGTHVIRETLIGYRYSSVYSAKSSKNQTTKQLELAAKLKLYELAGVSTEVSSKESKAESTELSNEVVTIVGLKQNVFKMIKGEFDPEDWYNHPKDVNLIQVVLSSLVPLYEMLRPSAGAKTVRNVLKDRIDHRLRAILHIQPKLNYRFHVTIDSQIIRTHYVEITLVDGHGYPTTHRFDRKVSPRLQREFRGVVIPLRRIIVRFEPGLKTPPTLIQVFLDDSQPRKLRSKVNIADGAATEVRQDDFEDIDRGNLTQGLSGYFELQQ